MDDDLRLVMNVFQTLVFPVILVVWKEVKETRKDVHGVDRRMVRVETKLGLPKMEE